MHGMNSGRTNKPYASAPIKTWMLPGISQSGSAKSRRLQCAGNFTFASTAGQTLVILKMIRVDNFIYSSYLGCVHSSTLPLVFMNHVDPRSRRLKCQHALYSQRLTVLSVMKLRWEPESRTALKIVICPALSPTLSLAGANSTVWQVSAWFVTSVIVVEAGYFAISLFVDFSSSLLLCSKV